MKDFATIDSAQLDSISGGRAATRAVGKAAKWAWQNVVAPMGGGALYEAASDWLGGRNSSNNNQQQAQPPSGGQ